MRRLTYQPKQVLGLGHEIITETDIQKYEPGKSIQKPKRWLLMYRFKLSISGRGALY